MAEDQERMMRTTQNSKDEITRKCNQSEGKNQARRRDKAPNDSYGTSEITQPISGPGGAGPPAEANAPRPITRQRVGTAKSTAEQRPMKLQVSHGRN